MDCATTDPRPRLLPAARKAGITTLRKGKGTDKGRGKRNDEDKVEDKGWMKRPTCETRTMARARATQPNGKGKSEYDGKDKGHGRSKHDGKDHGYGTKIDG